MDWLTGELSSIWYSQEFSLLRLYCSPSKARNARLQDALHMLSIDAIFVHVSGGVASVPQHYITPHRIVLIYHNDRSESR